MPRKSTIPPALQQLLKRLGTNVLRLSRKTQIPRARLVEIYETGELTQSEMYALFKALGPPLVDYLTAALGRQCADRMVNALQMQIGVVNQNGYRNKQRNNLNYHNHKHLHLHVTVANEPEPKALGGAPQRWEQQPVQPGGQVRRLGQPMQPGSQVQQIGAAAPERELGKAA
ncbi:hypothetical protein [Hymenobacter convexus]|uniref:hypothetical protein n=1 Tax=Hymenobacter sp. CA1UV-4 TaxID=3063782 RepID=UPI0027141818|nr:hypothetical protein [Hymenobacter sp. CA1UV-4]MDO7853186.1 hypothetical protein [Hymenobacter sp. CA1UV-4]